MAQRVPGGLGSQIFITFGTWRWWGCQPHTPATFTPRKCPWYSFSLGSESTPSPWYGRKEYVTKNPVTPPGIDPGTARQVAQRLNHYATPGPRCIVATNNFISRFAGWFHDQDGVVGIWARLQAEPSVFRIPGRAKELSLLQSIQTVSEGHPVSCVVGTERYFPGGKAVMALGWTFTSVLCRVWIALHLHSATTPSWKVK